MHDMSFRGSWYRLAALVLVVIPHLSFAVPQPMPRQDAAPASTGQSGAAASAPAALFGSLPLKRDDSADSGIGAPAAAGIAAGVLIACIIASIALRRSMMQGARPVAKGTRAAWWHSLSRRPGGGSVRVLALTGLTPQARLFVVEWHGKEYLLSATSTAVAVIDTHPVARLEGGADGSPTGRNTEAKA